MSKFFDFLNTAADKLHDFFGTHGGVLPPLPVDKHWFGAENDSNEKRRVLYESNRFTEGNRAYEKKLQEELRQWNADKAQGKTPTYLPYEQWKKTPEASFVHTHEFRKLTDEAQQNSPTFQSRGNFQEDALAERYSQGYRTSTLESVKLTRAFRSATTISDDEMPEMFRPFRQGAWTDSSRLRIAKKGFLSESPGDLTERMWVDGGYAGSFVRQISGDPLAGLEEGQRFFLSTIHGGSAGDLASHFTGGYYDSPAWTKWDPSKVKELGQIRDHYIACCHPASVKEKYPFLNIEHDTATDITHHRWGENNTYHSYGELSESDPLIVERKKRLSKSGFGLLDEPRQIEQVLEGNKPLFSGTSADGINSILEEHRKKNQWLTTLDFDKQYQKELRDNGWVMSNGLPIRRKWREVDFLQGVRNNAGKHGLTYEVPNAEHAQLLNEDPFVTAYPFHEVDGWANYGFDKDLFYMGRKSEVDKALEFEKRHVYANTTGSPEYWRERQKILGISEESLDLQDFLKSPGIKAIEQEGTHLDSAGHAYLRKYPIFGPSGEGYATVHEALLAGLSPSDIHESIYKNLEAKIGKLPGDIPFPKGRDVAAAETGVAKMMKKVVDGLHGKKILGIAGLAIGLGIGLPAVASASTGTSPTDGGLGSTLAIAGTATAAGVGAYLFAKIGTTGAAAAGAAGGAAGGGAGAAGAAGAVNRNTGSRIYNSSFVQNELDLTTRGFFAGLGSVINDFGFNRRTGSFDTSGAPDSFIDSLFGKSLKGDGYVHPVYRKEEAFWKVAHNIDDAYQGWKDYINTSYRNSSGISKLFQGVRYHGFRALDAVGDGWLNKQLVKAGGFSTVVAPALMAHGALSDFKEGYRRGGLIGGALKTVTGLMSGLVQNKVIAGILLNPMTGLLGAGITAAAGYAAFKIFDVRNEGANYIRSGRMGGLSWNRGPTPGMSGSMAATARQRALNSMNNSKFNAMKAMGNESYMMNVPKSRYANSTGIHGITPVLSY